MQPSSKRPSPLELRRLIGSVNQLRFNDNHGEVSFFGQKMIILRRDVFRVMREGLERLVGDQAAPFLSYLASGIGINEGNIFRESVKSNGGDERASLENLVHSAFEDTNLGLGKIKVHSINFDQGIAQVSIANCFEALENGPAENPNCMFTSGFLAGLFAEVFDTTVQANEVRCISKGDTNCEFQIEATEKPNVPDASKSTVPAETKTPAPELGPAIEEKPKDTKAPEPKPLASEPAPPTKTIPETKSETKPQPDVDAGVEKAAKIAKRKQGFWERHLKK